MTKNYNNITTEKVELNIDCYMTTLDYFLHQANAKRAYNYSLTFLRQENENAYDFYNSEEANDLEDDVLVFETDSIIFEYVKHYYKAFFENPVEYMNIADLIVANIYKDYVISQYETSQYFKEMTKEKNS